MSETPTFTITYWGLTGTLSAPLRPAQVTEKLEAAICKLACHGSLQSLRPGPELAAQVHALVAKELSFAERSTYSGNTTCVEVETPDAHLVLDCGSGYRELGVALEARWRAEGAAAKRKLQVLVSHAHMDHTFATPFFSPYYNAQNAITIWGSRVVLDSLAAVLNPDSAMSQIYFPPTAKEMKGISGFRPLQPGISFAIEETRVSTYALNHPGSSLAFRIEHGGRAFVFATDHEQPEVPDSGLAGFARGADLFYTEGQYTQREYDGLDGMQGDPPRVRHGWGHTPMEACVRTAVAAGVKALHIGHRDPRRTDADLAQLEEYIATLMRAELRAFGFAEEACCTRIPYEGLQVCL